MPMTMVKGHLRETARAAGCREPCGWRGTKGRKICSAGAPSGRGCARKPKHGRVAFRGEARFVGGAREYPRSLRERRRFARSCSGQLDGTKIEPLERPRQDPARSRGGQDTGDPRRRVVRSGSTERRRPALVSIFTMRPSPHLARKDQGRCYGRAMIETTGASVVRRALLKF